MYDTPQLIFYKTYSLFNMINVYLLYQWHESLCKQVKVELVLTFKEIW